MLLINSGFCKSLFRSRILSTFPAICSDRKTNTMSGFPRNFNVKLEYYLYLHINLKLNESLISEWGQKRNPGKGPERGGGGQRMY